MEVEVIVILVRFLRLADSVLLPFRWGHPYFYDGKYFHLRSGAEEFEEEFDG